VKVFMVSLGTLGDFIPYVVLGRELRARGYQVTILSDATKRDATVAAGLEFAEVMSRGDWETFVAHPSLWRADTSVAVVFKLLLAPAIRPCLEFVRRHHEPGNTLLVGGAGALGLQLARERFGLPLVHLHLSPYQAVSQAPADAATGQAMRDFIDGLRRGAGLPAIPIPFFEWYNAADLAIAAYPRWFHGASRAGEPADLQFSGFLFEPAVAPDPRAEWLRFIGAGAPPVVFTAGTGMRHGQEFFRAAAVACEQRSLRAVFLTRHRGQLPPSMPPTIHAADYVRLDQLLPHVAAIVHHGGIGTLAQAMKAGVPQLVLPMALDQFDNGAQLQRLGVGMAASGERPDGSGLASLLATLLGSASLLAASRDSAQRLRGNAADEIIECIERFRGARPGWSAPAVSQTLTG
jgi:UDP:flavonoid glycosyltransferase YjiC (YdhE family)